MAHVCKQAKFSGQLSVQPVQQEFRRESVQKENCGYCGKQSQVIHRNFSEASASLFSDSTCVIVCVHITSCNIENNKKNPKHPKKDAN